MPQCLITERLKRARGLMQPYMAAVGDRLTFHCVGLRVQARCFAEDRRGATVVEYGLMAAIIAVGIIASIQMITPKAAENITDPISWL